MQILGIVYNIKTKRARRPLPQEELLLFDPAEKTKGEKSGMIDFDESADETDDTRGVRK